MTLVVAPAGPLATGTAAVTRAAVAARLESGQDLELRTAGTSMVPFLRAGDLVGIRAVAPAQVRLGEVLAFWRGGEVVVHRCAGRSGTGLRELGDNLRVGTWVAPEDLLGRVAWVDRGAGRVALDAPGAQWARRYLGLRAWFRHRCRPLLERLRGRA